MLSMFCGADGKVSMMRVSTFITVATILVTFTAHNVLAMVHGQGFVSMGVQEAGLLAAAIGLKALQTKFEAPPQYDEPEEEQPEEAPDTTSDLPSDKGQ
jgi:hypothetical protein